jgi:hypothetical protein
VVRVSNVVVSMMATTTVVQWMAMVGVRRGVERVVGMTATVLVGRSGHKQVLMPDLPAAGAADWRSRF